MKSKIWIVAAIALCLAISAPALASGKPEPKTSVVLAKTWAAAVEEAKTLNLPIVVHSHGMFCGPCWSMHDSVMCNKDYIKFSADNTVEVISLDRLQEGIDKKDKRAETYDAKVDGKAVKYMVEFPGLTVEDMLGLAASKAASYNTTGKIPYTCVIDPYTESEITHWSGGQGAGTIEDAVTDAKKALQKDHGKGIARKDLKPISDAEAAAVAASDKGDFTAALDAIAKVASKAKDGTPLADRVKAAKDKVAEAAAAALAKIEEKKDSDAVAAKRELLVLLPKLKGLAEVETKAKGLLATL